MDISSGLLALISASFGAVFTFWGQRKLLEQRINLEFRAKQAELVQEKQKVLFDKLETKIEKAHVLVSELGREFSLTFLNIDWEANLSMSDYDAKYRILCDKCSRLQMLVDLYVPTLSEEVNDMSENMNMYWGNFRIVLSKTEQGKKPDELGNVFENAVKYSRLVPEQAFSIKFGLSDYYRNQVC
ncbi:hypothetical protein R1U57_004440 [Vibrio parahaemolyticus]|nr:hypothetical protein [Vibrio parahaemolyticus]